MNSQNRKVIERTAYPRFKQYPSAKKLADFYTPTPEEIKFVKPRVKSNEGLLSFTVMLKSFQRLSYFPHPEQVPIAVIKHLRSCLKLREWVKAIPSERQRRIFERTIAWLLKTNTFGFNPASGFHLFERKLT